MLSVVDSTQKADRGGGKGVPAAWPEPEVERKAGQVAMALRRVADNSRNEEEQRIGASRILEDYAAQAGLVLEARHEYAVGCGRADSVYGRVLVEFEAPGSLSESNTAPSNQHAIRQVQQYAEAMSVQDGQALARILGVVIDGYRIIFLRHRQERWEASPATEVGRESIAQLLFCLNSLQGKALVPQNLVDDFGAHPDKTAGRCVRALYQALRHSQNRKVLAIFSQWRLLFSEVCGYELDSPTIDLTALAKSYGVTDDPIQVDNLFFCIHSYYGTLIKLLAAEIVTFYRSEIAPSYLAGLESLSSQRFREELASLEQGGIFRQLGVHNFLEGDFFAWYLEEWCHEVDGALRGLIRTLRTYDPGTVRVDPDETRDLLKKLYQYLLPAKLRHDLGEFYTPDWLAELVLDEIGYDGDPAKRILDPSCGSGTFLVLAIKRARDRARDSFLGEANALESILHSIVGFDLNPLAVITARTNYLIALGELLRYRRGEVEIPIYLCDAVLTPTEPRQLTLGGRKFPLETAVGKFEIPLVLASRERISALATVLEQAVEGGYSTTEFIERLRSSLPMSQSEFAEVQDGIDPLYQRFCQLHSEGRDGIWARILKNFFAPLFAGQFEYVVGNPPWVAWNTLPSGYRKSTATLWSTYGFFTQKGYRALVPAGPLDLSALFLYVAADKYLKEGGQLGFLVTQTLFKSAGAGEGFRRFALPPDTSGMRRELQVQRVHDLVAVKPFERASNRTAAVFLVKGQPTKYPIPYTVWRRIPGRAVRDDATLDEARRAMTQDQHCALPLPAKGASVGPWLTGPEGLLTSLQEAIGKSAYRARSGIHTHGANAIYFFRALEELHGGLTLVENVTERTRGGTPTTQVAIETDLLYPLVRGRDVNRWRADPLLLVLLPHTRDNAKAAMSPRVLRSRYPAASQYLYHFQRSLAQRSLMKKLAESGSFYQLFKIGSYTFTPYKVVWRDIATDLIAAVAGPQECFGNLRPAVPDHTTMMIGLHGLAEAHYLCAVLNSSPSRAIVRSYTAMHLSTHILDHIKVPQFRSASPLHRRLSALSIQAHAAAASGGEEGIVRIEEEVDVAAAELWGMTPGSLSTIRKALRHSAGRAAAGRSAVPRRPGRGNSPVRRSPRNPKHTTTGQP